MHDQVHTRKEQSVIQGTLDCIDQVIIRMSRIGERMENMSLRLDPATEVASDTVAQGDAPVPAAILSRLSEQVSVLETHATRTEAWLDSMERLI